MGSAGQRLGILGGTFDPPHLGHLLIAQAAWEALSLERVLFVPAARNPLKDAQAESSPERRLGLVQAAVAGDERFGVEPMELERQGPSYSIDTARELARRYPDASLFWIIGADQLALLPRWKGVEEMGGWLDFIAVARPGQALEVPPELPPELRVHRVEGCPVTISSTEIRDRLREGRPVRYLVPDGVHSLLFTGQTDDSTVTHGSQRSTRPGAAPGNPELLRRPGR